ncbi:hypothetical protein D3C75_342700 [compost metagenome]
MLSGKNCDTIYLYPFKTGDYMPMLNAYLNGPRLALADQAVDNCSMWRRNAWGL